MPPFDPDQFQPQRRRDLALSLLFVVASIVLISLPSDIQEEIAGALRGSVLAPFLLVQTSLHEAGVRAGDVADLQDRLDAALAALAAQRTLRQENEQLRDLLELEARAGPGFLAASVIRSGTRGSESMFLVDAGSEDGVHVNAPVVSGDGLVGLVREVGDRSSLAMDWTHPDFRVGAMTLDGAGFGMIEPRHGAFREEDRLLLNGVPYYTSLEDGTAVVTSGQGGVYPRGLLVGAIQGLAEAEAGWRRSYWVAPAARPGAVTHVLVFVAGPTRPDEALDLWGDTEALPTEDAPSGPLEEILGDAGGEG